MNSALEAKPPGAPAPMRLVASITVLPSRPVTVSNVPATAAPGIAISTASAPDTSPPSLPIRWSSCPAFSHRSASPPPTLPFPTTAIFTCAPFPGSSPGDDRRGRSSAGGDGFARGGFLRGLRGATSVRSVRLYEVALADQKNGQRRRRERDERAEQQDGVQTVDESGSRGARGQA